MALSAESSELAIKLAAGAGKIFANAEALFTEASLLANASAWPRAAALHQISSEECAKIEMLGAALAGLLLGHNIDTAKLRRSFSRHEAKNNVNAYFLPVTEEEEAARSGGSPSQARAIFRELQEQFHTDSNELKNSSLYVDWSLDFSSPLDRIGEKEYSIARMNNEKFLGIASDNVRNMALYAEDLESASTMITQLLEAIEEVKEAGAGAIPSKAAIQEAIQRLAKKIVAERKGDQKSV